MSESAYFMRFADVEVSLMCVKCIQIFRVYRSSLRSLDIPFNISFHVEWGKPKGVSHDVIAVACVRTERRISELPHPPNSSPWNSPGIGDSIGCKVNMATESITDLRVKIHNNSSHTRAAEYEKKPNTKPKSSNPSTPKRNIPRSKYDDYNTEEREEELQKVMSGIQQHRLFTEDQCKHIEKKIDKVVKLADLGLYKEHTVDRWRL